MLAGLRKMQEKQWFSENQIDKREFVSQAAGRHVLSRHIP